MSLRSGAIAQRTNGQALRHVEEQPCALPGQGGHLPRSRKPLKDPQQAMTRPVTQHTTGDPGRPLCDSTS